MTRFAIVLALLLAPPALASEEPAPYVPAPTDRLWYSNATFARVNPLGLVDVYRLGWRRNLSTRDSLLLRDTYSLLGGTATVTPAWFRLGAYGEVQPLAVLRVFGEVSAVQYFGTFDQVLSWSDPSARYSDRTLEQLGEKGSHAPRSGWIVNVGATLQAKVGPIAVRSTGQLARLDLGLPDGDAWFYEQMWDRLAPDGGWMVLNDLDLLAIAGRTRVGLRHTFSDGLGDGGAATDGALSHHRFGPLFAFQLADEPHGSRVDEPTVFVLAQWWLQHPYRTGEEQPAGLPLVAAGFAFNGDLARPRP